MALRTAIGETLIVAVLTAGAGLLGGAGCSDTVQPHEATEAPVAPVPPSAESAQKPAIDAVEPETAMDRSIREQLNDAIEHDPALTDREISFTVDNGDITVTGNVRSETERRKINELAMQLPGVKSVANALRVLPS